MNKEMYEIIKNKKGFIAALDQSGGSSSKTLKLYGINENEYSSEEEMLDLMHKMRTRVIKSKSFDNNKIIGTILFKKTMETKIDDLYTADFLWINKNIVSFLKVDIGLEELNNGVRLMKEITFLKEDLILAKKRNIFGTKMRSVIYDANVEGIRKIVKQQFEYAKKIISMGLVPILEPEVDINSNSKEECERILKEEIITELKKISKDSYLMFKFSIPSIDNYYDDLLNYENVIRIVCLSGGYELKKACSLLSKNKNLIASFSRALLENINVNQNDKEFDETLKNNIDLIYKASI